MLGHDPKWPQSDTTKLCLKIATSKLHSKVNFLSQVPFFWAPKVDFINRRQDNNTRQASTGLPELAFLNSAIWQENMKGEKMRICNHQKEHVDSADVYYPPGDAQQSHSQTVCLKDDYKPLTEVWALLRITKHSIQLVDSPHSHWIRPNVFPLTHTGGGGKAEEEQTCL